MRSKRKSRDNSSSTMAPQKFPHDTIADILSRLPVKTLTRFKSVSKPFSSLIKAPLFVSSHLRRATSPLLLRRCCHNVTGPSFSFSFLDVDTRQLTPVEIPFTGYLIRYPKIVGSCNGLLCVDVSPCYATGFLFWNIATQEFRSLPKPELSNQNRPIWMVATGFGSNPGADHDYKLVRIVSYCSKADNFPAVRAEVFSWSTGSWRVIDDETVGERMGSCVISEGQKGVVVNGALHWLGSAAGKRADHAYVVSFDLGTEEIEVIKTPNFTAAAAMKVIGFKGSLALAVYPNGLARQMDKLELWVLEEDYAFGGDKRNWAVSRTINTHSNGLGYPVGVLNESTLVMRKGEGHYSQLLCFNPTEESCKRFHAIGPDSSCEVYSYVESLVPVEAGGEHEVLEQQQLEEEED
ncbi:hypothetical protein Tsubulata_012932 [Turnera subulata]|uniref:F-box domain-containing protein n=1 Tax=Turnera subulata TaxID=218843 RepID=A0A9Q0FZ36_9ROSI|nr:hypothetical protein Tsubulata_012932 [Turnera subulata]